MRRMPSRISHLSYAENKELHSILTWSAIEDVVTFFPGSMHELLPTDTDLNVVRAESVTWLLRIMWCDQPH